MKIRVIIQDPEKAKLFKQAAEWFAEKLLNPFQREILNDINIRTESMDDMGLCYSHQEGPARPRDFEILVHYNLDTYWQIRTLAHEFVHVRQRATRQLVYDGRGRRFWDGKDVTDIPWAQRPQEIEANALEGPLADEFLIKVKGWRRRKAGTYA